MRTSLAVLPVCVVAALSSCGQDAALKSSGAGTRVLAPVPASSVVAAAQGAPAEAPAWLTARVAVHFHSPISHDACDGDGKPDGPLAGRDQTCLAQLREALCASKIDVGLLTDHPAHTSELTFEEDLLYLAAAGDQLVIDASGAPIANRIACPGGGTALVAAGFEGTHSMPLGLHGKLDPALYGVHALATTAPADLAALNAGVKAAGGVLFMAHSEESDMPASVLAPLEGAGMEWYNVHGNFKMLLGQDQVGAGLSLKDVPLLLKTLKGFEPFLAGSSSGASADLVYLVLLSAAFPEPGLQKWHDVLGHRFVPGALGNDVHRNISVAPLCKGALAKVACAALAGGSPNALTLLATGGDVRLVDGERIDTFARVLRWLNNRVLVKHKTVDEAVAALAAGRGYGVFAVLGEPGAFAYWADAPAGRIELGGEAPAAGTKLRVRLPDPPAPELGAQWTPADAAKAELRAILWRTTAAGKTQVAELKAFGATVEVDPPGPGAYSLEVLLTPHHLDAALGSASALASHEYRWLLTNAIVLK